MTSLQMDVAESPQNIDTNDLKSEEEIPEYTETGLTDNKEKQIVKEICASQRIAKFYIKHLLDHNRIKKCEKGESQYVVGNIVFSSINLVGIVLCVSEKVLPKGQVRTQFFIDDGTGVLECYMSFDKHVENLLKNIELDIETNQELINSKEDELLLKVGSMMLENSQNKLKHISKPIQKGDVVQIIGSLSELFNRRCCYVKRIKIYPKGTSVSDYLEKLHELYEKVYGSLF